MGVLVSVYQGLSRLVLIFVRDNNRVVGRQGYNTFGQQIANRVKDNYGFRAKLKVRDVLALFP